MITDLEKQFFDTFGIEPYETPSREYDSDGEICSWYVEYPQITDRILLELICILTKHFDYADQNWLTKCDDTKELKVSVLRLLLLCTTSTIEKYKRQVQALFKEER